MRIILVAAQLAIYKETWRNSSPVFPKIYISILTEENKKFFFFSLWITAIFLELRVTVCASTLQQAECSSPKDLPRQVLLPGCRYWKSPLNSEIHMHFVLARQNGKTNMEWYGLTPTLTFFCVPITSLEPIQQSRAKLLLASTPSGSLSSNPGCTMAHIHSHSLSPAPHWDTACANPKCIAGTARARGTTDY